MEFPYKIFLYKISESVIFLKKKNCMSFDFRLGIQNAIAQFDKKSLSQKQELIKTKGFDVQYYSESQDSIISTRKESKESDEERRKRETEEVRKSIADWSLELLATRL